MTTRGQGDRTCRLTLTITIDGKNTEYTIRPIHSDYHIRAWQINRGDGMVYHCTQELSGKRSCDCGDCEFREHSCKHIKSCAALGLFLSPRELLALQREAKATTPRRP